MTLETILAIKPYEGQDFYVPSYKILVQNKELQVETDVLSVTFNDSLSNIDSFDLAVNNWDPDRASRRPSQAKVSPFKYSDERTFAPWQDVELFMGYWRNGKDERRRMLLGEITTMSPNFPASGGSTLTVRGLDIRHRFRTQQVTKQFFDKKDSEVARTLIEDIASDVRKKVPQLVVKADEDQLNTNIQREEPLPYLEVHNQYPINFLIERSRRIGYDLSVMEKPKGDSGPREVTVRFGPTSDVKKPAYQLDWGQTLISFQPTFQTANQVSEVTVRGWNPKTKQKFEETVKRSQVEGVVKPVDLDAAETALSQKLEIMVDHPIQSAGEAKEVAKKTLLQLAQGIVEAKGKTIGLPDLRAGTKIQVGGLGKRFSGMYLVTATTHTIGEGGYTTDFSARMEQKVAGA
jgi:phage protein D